MDLVAFSIAALTGAVCVGLGVGVCIAWIYGSVLSTDIAAKLAAKRDKEP